MVFFRGRRKKQQTHQNQMSSGDMVSVSVAMPAHRRRLFEIHGNLISGWFRSHSSRHLWLSKRLNLPKKQTKKKWRNERCCLWSLVSHSLIEIFYLSRSKQFSCLSALARFLFFDHKIYGFWKYFDCYMFSISCVAFARCLCWDTSFCGAPVHSRYSIFELLLAESFSIDSLCSASYGFPIADLPSHFRVDSMSLMLDDAMWMCVSVGRT